MFHREASSRSPPRLRFPHGSSVTIRPAQLLCVSYAQDLSDKFARECRGVMTSDWYKRLFTTRLGSQKQSVGEFVTTANGYRLATSVGGVITGRGSDFLIIDDPLKPAEAESEAQRNAANEWYDNTLYSRLNDKRDRLHHRDHAALARRRSGRARAGAGGLGSTCASRPLPKNSRNSSSKHPFGRGGYTRKEGDAPSPGPGAAEVLASIPCKHRRAQFRRPVPAGTGAARRRTGQGSVVQDVHEGARGRSDSIRCFRVGIPRTSCPRLADYSVCTTWGLKDKRLYLLHVFRKRLNYPELKRAVREQANMHRATLVLIEDKASGTQLVQELVNEGLRIVRAVKPEGDKVMRFNAQTATIENGFVYLPQEAPWLADYVHEITTFPNAKYDDQADSTSQALAWINNQPPRPAALEALRRELARSLQGNGLSLDKIATQVESTPEEITDWQKEFQESQARVRERLEPKFAGRK